MGLMRIGQIGAGLVLALGLLAPSSAAAKEAIDPNAPAYVDINRVLGEYRKTTAFNKYQVRIREQAKKYAEEMEFLVKVRHCSDAERTEALALRAKPKLDKKQQARLDALVKRSDALENELAGLGQKEKPTDAEAARIAELSKMRQDAIRFLTKEEADRRDKIRDLESELLVEVENELLKLVQQLAKEKRFTTVYNRTAVLVGGVDLTEDVLKKLPK